jgi:UDP:flavonoid glycosyltransferase YjiC (YdhE family)
VRFQRSRPLPPAQFQYLEGCVRQEKPYTVPRFAAHNDAPLVYLSFGSLGAGDVELAQAADRRARQIAVSRARQRRRTHKDQYTELPPNVIVDGWFPQPSVIPQVDVVIHHGGNNSFTECLLFGKPAIIMPFAWDGHDNATRVQETGHGFRMNRADWTEAALAAHIDACLHDRALRARVAATSALMRAQDGPAKAAQLLAGLLGKRGDVVPETHIVRAAPGASLDAHRRRRLGRAARRDQRATRNPAAA